MIGPRAARRRFALVSFLTWLPTGLTIAPMVLLMGVRGLDLAEVGLVFTVYAIVTIALELPTGGLSDVVGRRVVLAASAAVSVVALAGLAFATTLWMFLAVSVLKGIARALSSGPAEAWYVDTLHAAEGQDADLKPGLARGGAMGSVALCLGVLVGGAVPLVVGDRLATPLAVPPLMGSVAAVVLLVVVLFALPEPPHARRSLRGVLRAVPATVVTGVRLAAGGRVLGRLMIYTATVGISLNAVELLTPGRLAQLAGTAELGSSAYAVVAALGFAGSATGAALAPRLARLAGGSARGAAAGVVATAVSIGALAATAGLMGGAGLASAAAAYVVMFAAVSSAGTLVQAMTHEQVTASERTTVTSVSSLSLQLGGGLSNVALGAIAAASGVATSWGLVSVLVLASTQLFVRLKPPVPAPQ